MGGMALHEFMGANLDILAPKKARNSNFDLGNVHMARGEGSMIFDASHGHVRPAQSILQPMAALKKSIPGHVINVGVPNHAIKHNSMSPPIPPGGGDLGTHGQFCGFLP